MLYNTLEFTALLAGIVLPLLPLNRLYKKPGKKSYKALQKLTFSDYAVDEYGNLVEQQ